MKQHTEASKMRKLVILIGLLLATTAQAVEVHRLESGEQCHPIRKSLEEKGFIQSNRIAFVEIYYSKTHQVELSCYTRNDLFVKVYTNQEIKQRRERELAEQEAKQQKLIDQGNQILAKVGL